METARTTIAPVTPSLPVLGSFQPSETQYRLARILVYESDQESLSIVNRCLSGTSFPSHLQFDPSFCRDLSQVSDCLTSADQSANGAFHLLIWGLESPFEDSLRSLRELRGLYPDMKVVLLAPPEALAQAASIREARVEAFILKPTHESELISGIERTLSGVSKSATTTVINATPDRPSLTALWPKSQNAAAELEDTENNLGLFGASSEMRRVRSLIRKIGPSPVSVLITGESGTGKEMVASAIHQISERRNKPFVAINCAAIPKELLESELFGHAKGAFTGATTARRGLFEEANEGTILLDEIGDLSLPLQAKILRLLQTRQVKPLGQNTSREVDVRIISATHKNLKTLIQKGEFREDLYYRLNVMPIHLPPLRERTDDIVILAEHFLKRYGMRNRCQPPELSRKASSKLLSLPWRGNVRELENVIERAIVLSDGKWISDEDILSEDGEPSRVTLEDIFGSGMSLRDIEREYIRYVLNKTGNRKEAATRILGIDRKTLYRKEKLYGIRPPGEMN